MPLMRFPGAVDPEPVELAGADIADKSVPHESRMLAQSDAVGLVAVGVEEANIDARGDVRNRGRSWFRFRGRCAERVRLSRQQRSAHDGCDASPRNPVVFRCFRRFGCPKEETAQARLDRKFVERKESRLTRSAASPRPAPAPCRPSAGGRPLVQHQRRQQNRSRRIERANHRRHIQPAELRRPQIKQIADRIQHPGQESRCQKPFHGPFGGRARITRIMATLPAARAEVIVPECARPRWPT